MKYDILVVGCGLFGAVYAQQARTIGKRVLIIEKQPYVGGLSHTEIINNIYCHVKGPHHFNTNNKSIWDYITQFGEFNQYQAKVNASYNNKIYSLPFNMYTFYALWGSITPLEAIERINREKIPCENPINLEQWALSQIGTTLYETFVKNYTIKQWQKHPRELPPFIIKRIPIRFTYNNHYHDAKYCGVPIKGYTHLVENIVDGIDIKLNADFFDIKDWHTIAHTLIFTGPIDRFFSYKYGPLEYRSLRFEYKIVEGDFQGIGQINYTDETPWTRIIEHKHFYDNPEQHKTSVITYEYSTNEGEPFYPINDEKNNKLLEKYKKEAQKLDNVLISGRLGNWLYWDMDDCLEDALRHFQSIN